MDTPAQDNDDSIDEESSNSPSSSSAKRYNPKNCRKVRKLSSAQMQEREIQMTAERQTAFITKMNSIHGNAPDNDKSGDCDFARMIGKQMGMVGVSFCDLYIEKLCFCDENVRVRKKILQFLQNFHFNLLQTIFLISQCKKTLLGSSPEFSAKR